MRRNVKIDWGLLFSASKDNAMLFFQLLGMGLCFSSVGVFLLVIDEGYQDLGQLFGGGLFGLIGVVLVVAAFLQYRGQVLLFDPERTEFPQPGTNKEPRNGQTTTPGI